MSEANLRAITDAANIGQLKAGFTDWYIFRELLPGTNGTDTTSLWVNPRRMFLGTLEQAYRFLDPQGSGPAIVTSTRRDDLTGRIYEVRVDAITGQEQTNTIVVPKVSLTLAEFDASLQDY